MYAPAKRSLETEPWGTGGAVTLSSASVMSESDNALSAIFGSSFVRNLFNG